MYLYLSISEFKFFSKELQNHGYNIVSHTYHKYTATSTYFENIYVISKKTLTPNTKSSTLISKDVIRTGQTRGLMLLYIHWDEAEDNKGSLDLFLRKFNYRLAYLGSTPDWLGHPIYTIVNKSNIIQRRSQLST
jgi:hypothetical protein